MASTSPEPSAATKVLNTAELLEHIILEVDDMRTVLFSQRVCKAFKAVIGGSSKLQQALFVHMLRGGRVRKLGDFHYWFSPVCNVLCIYWKLGPKKKPQRALKRESWQHMYPKQRSEQQETPFRVELGLQTPRGNEIMQVDFQTSAELPLLMAECERLAVVMFPVLAESFLEVRREWPMSVNWYLVSERVEWELRKWGLEDIFNIERSSNEYIIEQGVIGQTGDSLMEDLAARMCLSYAP